MKATKPWGKALEKLRLARRPEEIGIHSQKVIAKGEVTYRQLAILGIAGQTEWNRWLNGPQGPTVVSLHRFLERMGYGWHDWAEAFEAELQTRSQTAKKKPPDFAGTRKASGSHH